MVRKRGAQGHPHTVAQAAHCTRAEQLRWKGGGMLVGTFTSGEEDKAPSILHKGTIWAEEKPYRVFPTTQKFFLLFPNFQQMAIETSWEQDLLGDAE